MWCATLADPKPPSPRVRVKRAAFASFLAMPVVAWLSDTVKTPWGRRAWVVAFSMPWILISFLMSVWAPPHSSPHFLYGWFVASAMVTTLGVSVGANNAWGAELTLRSDERVRLQGWNMMYAPPYLRCAPSGTHSPRCLCVSLMPQVFIRW